MTTETYPYNKKSPVQAMLVSAGGIAVITYDMVANRKAGAAANLWIMAALDLCVFIYIVYLYTVRLKPAMQQETALELTPAELIFKPKNIIIPWKTISDINTKAANRSGTLQYLDITLNESSETNHVRVDLDWIAGDQTDIYTAVVNYLYETRKAAEKYPHG